MDDLGAMAVFAKVVDAGSFSAAAQQLGISKSAASKQVSRLEDGLGARLLNRTTRRLSLTETGRLVHRHCLAMLEEARQAREAASRTQSEPRGRLRLSAPMTFGTMYLGPILADFLVRFPELEVDLSLSDRFVDLVDEGFDVALRIGDLPDSSLISRQLAENKMFLVAAPAYLDRHGTPDNPADLKNHNFLRYSLADNPSALRIRTPDGVVTVEVHGDLVANNGQVMCEAAIAGLGISVVPDFMVGNAIRDGRLKMLLPGCQPARASAIHLVYPHRRHLEPKVRVFIDFIADRFATLATWEI